MIYTWQNLWWSWCQIVMHISESSCHTICRSWPQVQAPVLVPSLEVASLFQPTLILLECAQLLQQQKQEIIQTPLKFVSKPHLVECTAHGQELGFPIFIPDVARLMGVEIRDVWRTFQPLHYVFLHYSNNHLYYLTTEYTQNHFQRHKFSI